jgi:sialic acid synthase SpsE
MENSIFISEVSSNHGRDLDRCFAFIDKSAEIGCDAVKFQLFKINKLFSPEILKKSAVHRAREAWELPVEFLPKLSDRCKEMDILFSCTPFYLEAVEELSPFVDFYKIASYELLWNPLLRACAETGKPIILSTGMAVMDEIKGAVSCLREAGCEDLTLLHCISGYPAPIVECNLAAIETIRSEFDCKTGWSDHSVSPAVIYRAVSRWDASVIEFHLDLDGNGKEYKSGHCWLPEEIKPVITDIHNGQIADGNGIKKPSKIELIEREKRADPEDGLRPLKHMR